MTGNENRAVRARALYLNSQGYHAFTSQDVLEAERGSFFTSVWGEFKHNRGFHRVSITSNSHSVIAWKITHWIVPCVPNDLDSPGNMQSSDNRFPQSRYITNICTWVGLRFRHICSLEWFSSFVMKRCWHHRKTYLYCRLLWIKQCVTNSSLPTHRIVLLWNIMDVLWIKLKCD